jgi:hypothetical protein
MEIMPVTTIDRKKIGKGIPGPITVALHRVYQEEVRAYLKTQVI